MVMAMDDSDGRWAAAIAMDDGDGLRRWAAAMGDSEVDDYFADN